MFKTPFKNYNKKFIDLFELKVLKLIIAFVFV